jgi:hypothetical protein
MNYQKIYDQIIKRAKTRQLEGYSEKHHIIPKCLGGNNNKENLVELTAREHFICHRLLCEIYPNELKLLYALWLMAIGKKKGKHTDPYNINSRDYEQLRTKFITNVTGKSKPIGFGKGKKITWGDKISKSLKNKPKPIGFGNKGKSKIKNINNKPILQYDKNNNFIKEWESGREAYRQLGIHYGSISVCCLGKTKTSGGYIWKFKD